MIARIQDFFLGVQYVVPTRDARGRLRNEKRVAVPPVWWISIGVGVGMVIGWMVGR